MSGLRTSAERAILIYNERTKLIANAYDRASTVIGAGSFLPLINLSKPSDGTITAPAIFQFALSALFFAFFAGVLHLLARRALRGLR
ncbi:hypothetical protein [Rhodopila globiformis]|uniref:Uncharacterized protein n=1 Tax=Rhodopila globiformis TaxID=1071 RepID=A0A2S6NL16_RHOGL|nr:hypothetical protein [Rhodopila globiformis]PPQ35845.1 hypothetical protein CCS01_06365 [Rhodopila globiformis]